MTDQSSPSSSEIAVFVKSPLEEVFINGKSHIKNKSFSLNSKDEMDDKENSCNASESHFEAASGISDTEQTMKERFSENYAVCLNGQIHADDSASQTKKHLAEKSNTEKQEGASSSSENLISLSSQESRGVTAVHNVREADYLKYKLDSNFESSMDRKSSAESGFEDQGNLSNTDSLEKKQKLAKDESSVSDLSEFESDGVKDVMTLSYSSAVSSTGSPVSSPSDFLSDMSMSTLLQQEVEPLIDEDSSTSVSCSFGNSMSESTCSSGDQTPDLILERSLSDSGMSPIHFEEVARSLPCSKSIEKISSIHKPTKEPNVVRASKSHENYLHTQDFQFVAIDIDDATYSLDQIPQNPTPTLKEDFDKSFDTISQQSLKGQDGQEESYDELDSKDSACQPDSKEIRFCVIGDNTGKPVNHSEEETKLTDGENEEHFDQKEDARHPTKNGNSEPKPCDNGVEESVVTNEKFKTCYTDKAVCDAAEGNVDRGTILDTSETVVDKSSDEVNSDEFIPDKESYKNDLSQTSELSDEIDETNDEILTKEFGPEGIFYQPPVKHMPVDQPSAQRLAKRLYNLDGFQKSDVSRHLSKK